MRVRVLDHIRVHGPGFEFVGFVFFFKYKMSFSLRSTSRHLGKCIEAYMCQGMYGQGENVRDIGDSLCSASHGALICRRKRSCTRLFLIATALGTDRRGKKYSGGVYGLE